MFYLELKNERPFDLMKFHKIYVELDDNGYTTRELAFDIRDNVVHKFPSNYFKEGKWGLFDMVPFDAEELSSDIDEKEFNKIWASVS